MNTSGVYNGKYNAKSKYRFDGEINEELKVIIYGYIIQYTDKEGLMVMLNVICGCNLKYDPKILLMNIDISKNQLYKNLLNISYDYDDINLYKYLYNYFDTHNTPINKKCKKVILHHFLLSDDYIFLSKCLSQDYLSYQDLFDFNIISDKMILSRILYRVTSISEIENILLPYSNFFMDGEIFNIHTKNFNLLHLIKKDNLMLFFQVD